MLICGSPMGWVMPSLMPKSAGLSGAFGCVVLERRFRPRRASLMTFWPNVVSR